MGFGVERVSGLALLRRGKGLGRGGMVNCGKETGKFLTLSVASEVE